MAATADDAAANGGERMILLISSDGDRFELPEAAASISETLSHMIEDDCTENGIPLPNVTTPVLVKVVEYFKKHAAVSPNPAAATEAAVAKASREEELKSFDAEFVDVDNTMLLDIINAANYLNAKDLLALTCQRVADLIKDMTPEQVREMLHIANDFTPEEEAEIRRENAWAFEN